MAVAPFKVYAATDAAVESWTSTLPKAEGFRLCQRHDVICAPAQSLHEVLNDSHPSPAAPCRS